jgi:peroxiredoxin (alkyl hydroperoxide reductase subunit C)
MSEQRDLTQLPGDLPRPIDDGAAAHLLGMRLPPVSLKATDDSWIDLAALPGWLVLAGYPRTGVPGKPPIDPNWDQIPGARGCTPQMLGYKALLEAFRKRHCQVFGISSQVPDYQWEMSQRLELGFPVLSDSEFKLADALRLPTQMIGGQRLYKRISLIVRDGRIVHVEYPVFPPDENAKVMLRVLDEAMRRIG